MSSSLAYRNSLVASAKAGRFFMKDKLDFAISLCITLICFVFFGFVTALLGALTFEAFSKHEIVAGCFSIFGTLLSGLVTLASPYYGQIFYLDIALSSSANDDARAAKTLVLFRYLGLEITSDRIIKVIGDNDGEYGHVTPSSFSLFAGSGKYISDQTDDEDSPYYDWSSYRGNERSYYFPTNPYNPVRKSEAHIFLKQKVKMYKKLTFLTKAPHGFGVVVLQNDELYAKAFLYSKATLGLYNKYARHNIPPSEMLECEDVPLEWAIKMTEQYRSSVKLVKGF